MSGLEILFVDDDRRFLSSLKRSLPRSLNLTMVTSPLEVLDLMKEKHFAVVVSDMKMPAMSGIDLLSLIKTRYPDTVRILFTGFADQQSAIDAVNQGEIFRFVTKPCDLALLERILGDAVRQCQLLNAERELLEKTLLGAIQTLSQILQLVNPTAQQRANRLKYYSRQIVKGLQRQDIWFFEMTALLSQIGCLNIPTELLEAYLCGQEVSDQERALIDEYPLMGEELLQQIPRLEGIARAIALQGAPADAFSRGDYADVDEKTALAAQVLHVVLEVDRRVHYLGQPFSTIVKQLLEDEHRYHPGIVAQLRHLKPQKQEMIKGLAYVKDLTLSMILCEDIYAKSGVLLASEGQQLSDFLLIGIKNYARRIGVNEPIAVLAPAEFSQVLLENNSRR